MWSMLIISSRDCSYSEYDIFILIISIIIEWLIFNNR